MEKRNRGGQYRFETAEEFEVACLDYFAWCNNNPIRGSRSVRSQDGDEENPKPKSKNKRVVVDEMYARPYTIEGLCDRLGISNWTKFVQDNKEREGFADVIDWAKNKIRMCQVEGGMVGIYNPNLTARLNGIAENIVTNEMPTPQVLEHEKR